MPNPSPRGGLGENSPNRDRVRGLEGPLQPSPLLRQRRQPSKRWLSVCGLKAWMKRSNDGRSTKRTSLSRPTSMKWQKRRIIAFTYSMRRRVSTAQSSCRCHTANRNAKATSVNQRPLKPQSQKGSCLGQARSSNPPNHSNRRPPFFPQAHSAQAAREKPRPH